MDDQDPATCATCGGPLVTLGTLGTKTHYRCRNCGQQTSDGVLGMNDEVDISNPEHVRQLMIHTARKIKNDGHSPDESESFKQWVEKLSKEKI